MGWVCLYLSIPFIFSQSNQMLARSRSTSSFPLSFPFDPRTFLALIALSLSHFQLVASGLLKFKTAFRFYVRTALSCPNLLLFYYR
jgi:hypothetical protein